MQAATSGSAVAAAAAAGTAAAFGVVNLTQGLPQQGVQDSQQPSNLVLESGGSNSHVARWLA